MPDYTTAKMDIPVIVHDVYACDFELSTTQQETFISYDLYQKIIGHCIKNGLICPIVDLIPEAFDLLYDVPINDFVGNVRCNMQLEYSHSPIEVEMLITSEPRNIIGLALQCKLPIMELIDDCSSSVSDENVCNSIESFSETDIATELKHTADTYVIDAVSRKDHNVFAVQSISAQVLNPDVTPCVMMKAVNEECFGLPNEVPAFSPMNFAAQEFSIDDPDDLVSSHDVTVHPPVLMIPDVTVHPPVVVFPEVYRQSTELVELHPVNPIGASLEFWMKKA